MNLTANISEIGGKSMKKTLVNIKPSCSCGEERVSTI